MKPALFGFDERGERRQVPRTPAPLPDGPRTCRQCPEPLPPLRRPGGLCQRCARAHTAAGKDRLRCRLSLISTRYKVRADNGRRERYALVQCGCGRQRELKWSVWVHHRPTCCNRCRMRDINARGFEAEYGR